MPSPQGRSTRFKTSAAAALAALAMASCGQVPTNLASTGMSVDAANSSISFVTTKAGAAGVGGVVEVSRFSRFSGGLGTDGAIRLEIDLASVDTGVGIRDDRLRTMLFNVAATPKVMDEFAASTLMPVLASLAANGPADLELAGTLSLAGQNRPVDAKLRVTRPTAQTLQVSTRAPIVVDAQQYGLKPGVEALREVVGLSFLASSAPVTFNLVLHAAR
jgi:polyisoprenoid-binding protein YceI